MAKSAFYAALLINVGSDWRPPARPPNTPPPVLVKFDPAPPDNRSTFGAFSTGTGEDNSSVVGGVIELGNSIIGGLQDAANNEHLTQTQSLAAQLGPFLPLGTTFIMVPNQPPSPSWGLSPSYSLYPPDTEFISSGPVETTVVNGTAPAPPGTSIPSEFTVKADSGEQVTFDISDYKTQQTLADRGITVERDFDARQQREIPADARFDARDHESPRDFDVGRDPG